MALDASQLASSRIGFTDAWSSTFADGRADSTAILALALGDLDGDLDADAVVCHWARECDVLMNEKGHFVWKGTIAFQFQGLEMRFSSAIALGDLDGDGDLDLVAGGRYNPRYHLNDGTGNFDVGTVLLSSMSGESVALADVNGDGHLDILLGNSAISVACCGDLDALFLNSGTGTFTRSSTFPESGGATTTVAFGDMNGDGHVDVLRARATGAELLVNDGNGVFTIASGAFPYTISSPAAFALGDVDGDGVNAVGFDPDRALVGPDCALVGPFEIETCALECGRFPLPAGSGRAGRHALHCGQPPIPQPRGRGVDAEQHVDARG